MKFLAIIFMFAGYVFVYASAAAGGKFATEPWAGLFADAYTGDISNQQVANAANALAASGKIPGGTGYTALSPTAPNLTPIRPRASAPRFVPPGFTPLSPTFPS